LLVAYDGSAAARRALAHAGELAGTAARVSVVNVMPEPGVGSRIGRPLAERNRQWRVLDEARRYMAARGIDADAVARVGDAAAEVVAVADEVGADVIVVAPHRGRTPHLHGSITGRIVRAASCDVLVVYSAGPERDPGT
jgi:nucleotide-binding universal stress UspA family protein